MKKNIKKILAASTISLLLLPILYTAVVEPTLASAVTDNVVVTLTVDAGITISDGSDVTMAPNLGITADSSIGNSYWTVKTNNLAGYSLAVKASSAPALVSGAKSLADFTEAVVGTPEAWTISSGTKEFGYSAFGTHVPVAFGSGANCGAAGIPTATLKYVGFKTTDKTIATSNAVTPVAGVRTDICFAAAQNAVYADSGVYTATITATASTL